MSDGEPAQSGVAPSRTGVVASNLLLEAELVRVLQRFGEARIRCVVLKGIPLVRRLFAAIDGRAVGDNDVLVQRSDVRRACALLERDGYRPLPFLDLERRLRYDNQFLLFKRGDGIDRLVEVHWNAFSTDMFRVPEQLQWAHTEPFVLRKITCQVFDPSLTINHLAAHFAQNGFAELRILREFARAWNIWAAEHASAACSLADTIGLRAALDYALSVCTAWSWIEARPEPISRRSRAMLQLLPAEKLSDDPALRTSYRRQLLPLLLADPAVVPRSLAHKLFPPFDELASTYAEPMSRRLYPRYVTYLFRPIRRLLRARLSS
jgi:putative nucleotidyltransferase-like protein